MTSWRVQDFVPKVPQPTIVCNENREGKRGFQRIPCEASDKLSDFSSMWVALTTNQDSPSGRTERPSVLSGSPSTSSLVPYRGSTLGNRLEVLGRKRSRQQWTLSDLTRKGCFVLTETNVVCAVNIPRWHGFHNMLQTIEASWLLARNMRPPKSAFSQHYSQHSVNTTVNTTVNTPKTLQITAFRGIYTLLGIK